MTRNFTLRLPESLANKLDAMRPAGQSQHSHILHILEEYVGDFDPGLVLGFIELAGGEIDPDSDCPECHTPFSNKGVWIGFTADMRAFGPVCGLCATTA